MNTYNLWIYIGLFSTPDSEQIIPENASKINKGTYVSTDNDEMTLHPTVLKKRLELYLKGIFVFYIYEYISIIHINICIEYVYMYIYR
jgi:hypothetical protein